MPLPLLPYVRIPAAIHPWDPTFPDVAARLIAAIQEIATELVAEHIGSSSVPGLAGKGYIDLQLAAPAERIPLLTDALVAAGWQRQSGAHAFPPTRPMLMAAVEIDARTYRSHLHIVPAGSAELVETRAFRDALRADPELRARYEAKKRAILDAGITDGVAYAIAKGEEVVSALCLLGLRRT